MDLKIKTSSSETQATSASHETQAKKSPHGEFKAGFRKILDNKKDTGEEFTADDMGFAGPQDKKKIKNNQPSLKPNKNVLDEQSPSHSSNDSLSLHDEPESDFAHHLGFNQSKNTHQPSTDSQATIHKPVQGLPFPSEAGSANSQMPKPQISNPQASLPLNPQIPQTPTPQAVDGAKKEAPSPVFHHPHRPNSANHSNHLDRPEQVKSTDQPGPVKQAQSPSYSTGPFAQSPKTEKPSEKPSDKPIESQSPYAPRPPLETSTRPVYKDTLSVSDSKRRSQTQEHQKSEQRSRSDLEAQVAPATLHQNATANVSSVASTTSARAQTLAELVGALVSQITQITKADRSETMLVLQNPPLFAGAQVLISEFNSAKGEFTLSFNNLTPEAAALILDRSSQSLLKENFERQGLTAHIYQVSQAPVVETHFTGGEQNDNFKNNDREGGHESHEESRDRRERGQR